jgi:uncharacterized protein YdgA (DUF945 family)
MARKLLLLILVLLVGGLLAGPFLFGGQAERLHRQFAQQLAQGGATVKQSEFSKGWLKSSARDVLEVCSVAAGCREVVISSVLHHGPIAITGILDGVAPLAPVQAVMLSRLRFAGLFPELKPELPDLTITTVAALDGNSRAVLEMPASTHTAEGKSGPVKLALGGISGEFAGNAGSERVSGHAQLSSLKLEDASGASLALTGVNVQVDGEGSDGGFVGKIEEKIAGLTVMTTAQDPQPLAIKGFSLSLNAARGGDGLSQSQFKGGIQGLTAGGRDYGPVTLEGETLRVNRAAMARLQREVKALETQKKSPQEILAVYQKGLQEVLGSRPEFNLKSLSLKTPEGELLVSLKLVGVPPQGDLNLAAWLNLLQAEFSLQIPAVTLWNILDAQLQQAAQQAAAQTGQPAALPAQDAVGAKVDELVKANVFVPRLDANAYTLQVALLEGRLLINGQENPAFGNLMQLMSAQKQAAPPPAAEMQEAAPAP